jgi:prevent-host-death family protein
METVAAVDTKRHFSELLDRVAKREKITITRYGLPAAVLMPVAGAETKLSHKEIVEGLRALRGRVKPGKMTVREMIEAGRRF